MTDPNLLPPPLVAGLVHDGVAVPPGDLDVASAVIRDGARRGAPAGDLLGPLLVPASAVDEMRTAAPPDSRLPIALVADDGLLGLAEARHAVQDDPWTELAYLQIAVPTGFDPADATRALIDELTFTVPTHVELPRTGFEAALDVLAEDGVERAAYRCWEPEAGSVPTTGELASFVHGAVDRSVPFSLVAGRGHVLRGTDDAGTTHHGMLNVLAAVAAALEGATTSEVAELLDTSDAEALLATATATPALKVRDLLVGYTCTEVSAPLAELAALTDLG